MAWNKEERMESLSGRVCDGEVDVSEVKETFSKIQDDNYLEFMVENANSTLKRGQNKLNRFKEALS